MARLTFLQLSRLSFIRASCMGFARLDPARFRKSDKIIIGSAILSRPVEQDACSKAS